MDRNYVYAVFKWSLAQTKELPNYQFVRCSRSETTKGWQFVYRLTVPMSDCHFNGVGNTRVVARQMAAKCAYQYLGIDPDYMDDEILLKTEPEMVFELAKETLPQMIIIKMLESSGIYYIDGLNTEQGCERYIYDKVTGDIRPDKDEPLIGNPQLMYVEGIADYVLVQYKKCEERLPEIYVYVYRALKDAQVGLRIGFYAGKREKYVGKYISAMEKTKNALEEEIMLLCTGATSGPKRRVIIDYLQAHDYVRKSNGLAIYYEKLCEGWIL